MMCPGLSNANGHVFTIVIIRPTSNSQADVEHQVVIEVYISRFCFPGLGENSELLASLGKPRYVDF